MLFDRVTGFTTVGVSRVKGAEVVEGRVCRGVLEGVEDTEKGRLVGEGEGAGVLPWES